MSDCEHTCFRCWLWEKKEVLKGWMFHHMPLRWRHRRRMRAAMKWRRLWREAVGVHKYLIDPRVAHSQRRMLRTITRSMEMTQFPAHLVLEEAGEEARVAEELTKEILDEALQRMYDDGALPPRRMDEKRG